MKHLNRIRLSQKYDRYFLGRKKFDIKCLLLSFSIVSNCVGGYFTKSYLEKNQRKKWKIILKRKCFLSRENSNT